eukprot:3937639-Rhodomonas_salina.2
MTVAPIPYPAIHAHHRHDWTGVVQHWMSTAAPAHMMAPVLLDRPDTDPSSASGEAKTSSVAASCGRPELQSSARYLKTQIEPSSSSSSSSGRATTSCWAAGESQT